MNTLTLEELHNEAHRLSQALGGHFRTNIIALEVDKLHANSQTTDLDDANERIADLELERDGSVSQSLQRGDRIDELDEIIKDKDAQLKDKDREIALLRQTVSVSMLDTRPQ